MKNFRSMIVITLALCLAGQAAWGTETGYVTDIFQITMRTGPSIQNKIVRMLSSGQPVEVLETQDEWSHVRFLHRENEIEGWVMSRYLISRQPWALQAKILRKDNEQLKAKLARVEKQLLDTGGRAKESANGLRETTQSLNQLQKKYDALPCDQPLQDHCVYQKREYIFGRKLLVYTVYSHYLQIHL